MGWESWKSGGSWSLVNKLNANLELVLLENYRDESVLDSFKDKDIIWFSGGMLGYLSYWSRRCSLDIHLKEILENKIYVGSSAGSMLLCNDSNMIEWDFVDDERGASVVKPLGLLDFDIYPHYEESLYEKIKKGYTGKKLYLLKNGEEIIVEDNKVTLVGEERIIEND